MTGDVVGCTESGSLRREASEDIDVDKEVSM